MRALHTGLLVLVGTIMGAPVQACPRGATCVITLDARALDAPAPRRPRPVPRLRAPALPARGERPPWTFERAPGRDDAAHATPSIWQVLRAKVYARLPRVEQRALTFTVAPVVIAGPAESVPGIGLAGDF